MAEPRVVFAGTPDFAVASLTALLNAGIRPELVLTQPDRPAGRGRRAAASPVRKAAATAGLPVAMPVSLKRDATAVARLEALQPDLLIVAAYGLLLPQRVLDVAKTAPLNVHASLLPRWRGAAPIQAAVRAGDRTTGISLMRMEAGLDTGPVYATLPLAIGRRENAGALHDRLALAGGRLLVETLPAVVSGELDATAQDDTLASYAPRLAKEDARIDWAQPAVAIDRAVRAYTPWPVSFTTLGGTPLRVFAARPVTFAGGDEPPGQVLAAGSDGIVVATGDGALRLDEVQLAGRRRIAAADLANQRALTGVRLGA